jgi:hypothetical protein
VTNILQKELKIGTDISITNNLTNEQQRNK